MEEKNKKGIFGNASNFKELYQTLKEKKKIIGFKERNYTAKNLIITIDEFRDQVKAEINETSEKEIKELIEDSPELMEKILSITRAEGLRVKVVELVVKEVIEKTVRG